MEKTDFQIMVDANNKAIKPWAIALMATNLFWAIVVSIMICLAWLSPSEYEQGQTQDFSTTTQQQTNKGVQ